MSESENNESVVVVTCPLSPDNSYLILRLERDAEAPTDTSSYPKLRETRENNPSQVLVQKYLLQSLPTYLDLPAEDIYILVSTKSGTGKAEECFETVFKPILAAVGLHEDGYTVLKTTSHESVREFASGRLLQRAALGIKQTVLLFSGDGGTVDLVNGLLENTAMSRNFSPTKVALFPLGTGNALFHSLHRTSESSTTPDDLVLALRDLLHGSHKMLPIFQAKFSPGSRLLSDEGRVANPIPNNTLYGTVVASYGFHSTLVADSDTAEWRKHGAKRFGMVGKELLFPADGSSPHAYKAHVKLNDAVTNEAELINGDEHEYVLLTLVSNLEKSFTINPASRPLDGKMRVIYFGPRPGNDIMKIMQLAYQGGKHVGEDVDLVGYKEVSRMRINFLEDGEDGRWRRVCIDGLIVRVEEGGWMEVSGLAEERHPIDVIIR